jgi:hypothetical protein
MKGGKSHQFIGLISKNHTDKRHLKEKPMELILKRNENSGLLGSRYDLFAKLELEPDELSRVRKAQPDKYLLWKDAGNQTQVRWRLCLIPGVIGSIILGMIAAATIGMAVGLPVMLIAWFPLTKLMFNQVRTAVTIADLITGRTIHSKTLDEMYSKEADIKEKVRIYCNNLEGMHALGNEQRINLLKPE